MRRVLLFFVIISLLMSGMAIVFAGEDTGEDLFSELDRRDQDDFPENPTLDSGVSVQSVINEVNQEGVPIVKVRLRSRTLDNPYTSISFAGTNNACIEIRDGLTGDLKATTTPGQVFSIKSVTTGVYVEGLNISASSLKLIPVNATDRTRIVWSSTTGRDYRGYLEISKVSTTSDDLKFINTLSIEEYLFGVVPNEMPGSWPIEALKAQAITARTYAFANFNKHSSSGYNICDYSGCCQAYLTSASEYTNATNAVKATAGQVATYDGNLITTYYSSTSGGYTESYYNWGGFTDPTKTYLNPPHLQSVEDPYDLNTANPRGSWLRYMTLDDLTTRFSTKGIGSVTSVESTRPQTVSGRQMEVTIRGSSGSYVVSGQSNIRSAFGFWSPKFDIVPKLNTHELTTMDWPEASALPAIGSWGQYEDVNVDGMYIIGEEGRKVVCESVHVIGYMDKPAGYEFKGGGWGHGVGMSQYGAYGMASDGKTCSEILQHYYQGTSITSAY